MAIRVNGGMPVRMVRYNEEGKNEALRLATQQAKEDPQSPVPLDFEDQSVYVGSSEEEETS